MSYFLSMLFRPATIRFLLWVFPIAFGGYFAFRYVSLKHALRRLDRDLREIQADLTRNQILHLPLPQKELEKFIASVNATLEQVRTEQQACARHEREFQKQIENISHDLRTPLTVILGYLKWMKRENTAQESAASEAFPRHTEFLEVIQRNALAMERLISQFYAFCLIDGPDYEPSLLEVDLCRLLRESLAANYQILEQASIHPDSLLPEHPVPVLGDPDALERIFTNLFQNAGRYAHSYLRIRLEETEDGQTRVFFLNDSAKLTSQDIPHLFDRFYRSDPARNRNSSGLGLTIAKSLAEKMGGSLKAEPGQESPAWPDDTGAEAIPQINETAVGNRTNAGISKKADSARFTVCFTLTLPRAVRHEIQPPDSP